MDPHPQPTRRDFFGYGSRGPDIRWPNDAKVAVSFVVNFEEGAEMSIVDGDDRNEAVYEVIDQRNHADPCIDTHFEFGTRVGYWRIADVFQRHQVPFTLSSCGRAVERSPWLALDAIGRGHEVSAHGWRWRSAADLSESDEREVIRSTVRVIEQVTGRRPVGWHSRSASTPNTRRLLVEQGFVYDSDAYNDDTPYMVEVDGRQHLVLPYSFDTNDMQFQHTQRFATASAFAEYVCDAFDCLSREGDAFPRMLSVGLHLRMIGRAGRIRALDAILEHIQRSGTAWIATRAQIAGHWLRHAA